MDQLVFTPPRDTPREIKKKDDCDYPKTTLKRSTFLSKSRSLSFSSPRYSSTPDQTEKGSGTLTKDVVARFTADGTIIASGHSGEAALPAVLGLVKSTDEGETWEPISGLGEADYHEVRDYHDDLPYLIASSSMPLVSQIVEADGKLLLDGGTSDSVPLLHSMLTGAKKHIVVLTQAAGYEKKPNKLMALMRQRYADYPYYIDRLQYRHYEYNRLYRWIEREQAAGRIFVIRPPEPVTVSSMEHDTEKLLALYEQGLAEAARLWPKLQEYLAD